MVLFGLKQALMTYGGSNNVCHHIIELAEGIYSSLHG